MRVDQQLPVEVRNGTHSVLICRAEHPRGRRGDGRFEGRLCGKRLQVVPFAVRPTYRAINDWSDAAPGCLVVRCAARDCRAFTEYEILRGARGAAPAGARRPTHDVHNIHSQTGVVP